ncbi:MAG TPA: PIN domain-containing protein [Stellaceae bacterium]|nr:PIN domain-containing protein [Stellaceae bacterium]
MTMPAEPGIVDTNVLVYALDTAAPQHTAARALLEAEREETAILYVTSQILCEFYSVMTNPRRVARPRTADEAMTVLADIMMFLHVLPVPASASDRVLDLLRRRPVTGGDVFDLHIVATMQANGIGRIYTFNVADFAAFPELTVVTPAAAP